MEPGNEQSSYVMKSGKEIEKLKFGIDRLLSLDPDNGKPNRQHQHQVAKPQPTVAIPCSDCVTSLFRCCSLSGANSVHEHHSGSYLHHHHVLSPNPSTSSIYTMQPIRPFATRPGKRWGRKIYTFLGFLLISSSNVKFLFLREDMLVPSSTPGRDTIF